MVVFVDTLGCAKNLVDSEKIMAQFKNNGHSLTNDPEKAQIILINTCSFINQAREETIDTILEYSLFKAHGKLENLVVTGCIVDMYEHEIKQELTEADNVIKISDIHEFINNLENENNVKTEKPFLRHTVTPYGQAYLKIADGCSRSCAFCTIPSFKGPFKSLSIKEIIAEADFLAKNGVKELNLVAQDLTAYGVDNNASLPELLNALCEIHGIKWIRLLYTYPDGINNKLIDVMQTQNKICPYIDLPLQHLDDNILILMKRWGSYEKYKKLIQNLRKNIPGIVLRTTLIVGFPKEDEIAFENMLERIQEIKFDRLGAFEYSDEETTPAYEYSGKVDQDTKRARYHEIMQTQREISASLLEQRIGNEYEALVEEIAEDETRVCRSVYEAPEVDGVIFVENSTAIPGDFINIRVTNNTEYDLFAEQI